MKLQGSVGGVVDRPVTEKSRGRVVGLCSDFAWRNMLSHFSPTTANSATNWLASPGLWAGTQYLREYATALCLTPSVSMSYSTPSQSPPSTVAAVRNAPHNRIGLCRMRIRPNPWRSIGSAAIGDPSPPAPSRSAGRRSRRVTSKRHVDHPPIGTARPSAESRKSG